MSVSVTCECTNTFSLKDEFLGRMVKCPACGASLKAVNTQFNTESQADPVFGRDIFLLRQQALRINERYNVSDEHGQALVFVERPAHLIRNVLAMLASVAAGIIWM